MYVKCIYDYYVDPLFYFSFMFSRVGVVICKIGVATGWVGDNLLNEDHYDALLLIGYKMPIDLAIFRIIRLCIM